MASTRLTDCVTKLADAWLQIKEDYEAEHPGHELVVTCTYRSPEEQFKLFQQGRRQLVDGSWVVDDDSATRTVTGRDGYKDKSTHNSRPSAALDFCLLIHGKVNWDLAQYRVVGEMAEARGLVWGGRWRTLRDGPHIELVPNG